MGQRNLIKMKGNTMKKVNRKTEPTKAMQKRILHAYFQMIGSKGGIAAKDYHSMTSERARQTVEARIAKYGQQRHKTVATADAPTETVSE